MSGWADRLVASGQADSDMVAQAERVLEAAALRSGDTVLDVGAGLGLLTLAAHDRIGDGWVIAIDPSVDALEELLALAHEAEMSGVMYLVGDADVLPLPDASVDAAVLRSALGRVPDLDTAIAELARVLRPDGRLSLREPVGPVEAGALEASLVSAGFVAVETTVEESADGTQLFARARRP
jgi:ubiquinone/menaquinone biosynthesis C-methylase UbiE